MDSAQDFKSLQDNVQKALVSTVKTINRVSNHDIGFQSLANPEVGTRIEESRARLLKITSRLLKASAQAGRVSVPKLETFDDIETLWGAIVDVLDSNFAKTDAALDEFHAQVKRIGHAMATQVESTAAAATPTETQHKSKATAPTLDPHVRHASSIPKPQLNFEKKVDNFPTGPWKPVLTRKPHAQVPLAESLSTGNSSAEEDAQPYDIAAFLPLLLVVKDDVENKTRRVSRAKKSLRKIATSLTKWGQRRFKHPYESEILTIQFPDMIYERADPIMYKPIDSTTVKWVDTIEDFQAMLAQLMKATEIAIDLEHHDYRTYYGLTCLMQISTRDQDWIVDTLVPWRHQMEALNDVFANPNIIKVLHGAFMDVKWLQRDLGLYLVGYFDTGLACEVLNYPSKSLASLLKRFVQFDADKKYQLADWRIRPLPDKMLSYARADTHYLLYIYDILRNELVESSDRARPEMDLFDLLLQKCQKQALDRYEYPAFDATTGEGSGGWLHHLMRHPLSLNGEQFSVFRAVWKWRDTEARKADESVHYLLPSQAVRNIAQILPPDLKALISRLPRHMQKAEGLVYDLWRVIQEAKVAGRTGPTMRQFLSERNEPKAASTPERTGKTVNGTPIDPEGVVPAPILPKSQLFGDVPVREQDKAIRPKASDYIPFSWQALPRSLQPDAEDFGEEAEESDTATQQGTGAKSHVPSKPEAADEAAFNLRAGSKRRREENEHHGGKNSEDDEMVTGNAMLSEGEVHEGPSSPGGADEVMDLDDAAGAENAEKAAPKILRSREKKDRKKALKKARKAAADTTKKLANQQGAAAIQQSQQQAGDSGQPSVGPFDYSQASSVLHAKRDQGSGANVAQQAAFNPYSKSGDDGPKGARKAPPLPGGRSATFKQ